MKTKGMSSPSLSEDDVKRVVDDRIITAFVDLSTNIGRDQFLPAQLRLDLTRLIFNTAMLIKQPATDTEPPASQASSAVPAEAGTPHQDRRVEDRRKRPEPKCYKG